MSGLNIITDAILEKAKEQANVILNEAEENRKALLDDAKNEAQIQINEIFQNSDDIIKNIELSSEVSAKGELARKLLAEKTKIIKEVTEASKQYIYKMQAEEYFLLLKKLLKKFAEENKPGEILFSEQDNKRITEDMKSEISSLGLVISEDFAKIDGGFVLRYGKIEENCSIEAIFHDRQDDITDFLNKKLF